jgi:hypothetical protein
LGFLLRENQVKHLKFSKVLGIILKSFAKFSKLILRFFPKNSLALIRYKYKEFWEKTFPKYNVIFYHFIASLRSLFRDRISLKGALLNNIIKKEIKI